MTLRDWLATPGHTIGEWTSVDLKGFKFLKNEQDIHVSIIGEHDKPPVRSVAVASFALFMTGGVATEDDANSPILLMSDSGVMVGLRVGFHDSADVAASSLSSSLDHMRRLVQEASS